jgi:hypothetical protein
MRAVERRPLLRIAALLVLATAVILFSLTSSVPPRPLFRAGDYYVLSGDFHVHLFPGDGGVPPWVMRDEAERAGLDVIAATSHNQTLAGRLGQWTARGAGPIVISGEEVTGDDYHLIALGVTARVRGDQPAARAIDAIHAQGGVAIAAHPTAAFRGWTDEAVSKLDGAEVAHPEIWGGEKYRRQLMDFQARARRSSPRLAAIGSSDAHMTRSLGECRTFLFVRDVSAAGVLDALRQGTTVALDMYGNLYGRPDLVQTIRDRRPSGRVDPHPRVRRLATALAFTGLAGALLLGVRRGEPSNAVPSIAE